MKPTAPVTKSFRLDPALLAAARLATSAKDDTEAVRRALEEVVERSRFRLWLKKAAGRATFPGYDG